MTDAAYTVRRSFPMGGTRRYPGETLDLSGIEPGRVASMVRLGFVVPVGGGDGPDPTPAPPSTTAADIDAMTKRELVTYAETANIPVDASATKATIKATIEEAINGI